MMVRDGLKPDTSNGFQDRYSRSRPHRVATDDILRRDGRLQAAGVHADFATSLRRRAVLANTHASTTLEGNPLGLDEMRGIAQGGPKPRSPERREVRNHLEYYRRLFGGKKAYEPLSFDEILETHSLLLDGVLESGVGTWKTRQNVIVDQDGKEVFYPTPPLRVEPELRSLQEWYASSDLAAPVKVAIWVHEFLSIHPFRDGNGRVARALTQRLLFSEGFLGMQYVALDSHLVRDPRGYMTSIRLTQTRQWDHTPWVDYFLQRLSQAYEEAEDLVAGMRGAADAHAGLRRALMQWLVARGGSRFRRDDFLQTPAGGGFHPVSVSHALGALAKEGYLTPVGAGRGRAYVPGPRFAEFLAE